VRTALAYELLIKHTASMSREEPRQDPGRGYTPGASAMEAIWQHKIIC
jgi:hypothetical protein